MVQEYFIHNGRKYNAGTVIVIQQFNIYSCSLCDTKAIFQYYDTDKNMYAFKIDNKTEFCSEQDFKKLFRGIYEEICNPKFCCSQPKEWSFKRELEIEGVLLAWIWYVFIMAVALIFNDRIGIWILTSVVFFSYRNRKLKEAGYK